MLKKEILLAAAEEKYKPMLKEVSIPDFTKCIAQFSNLHINEVNDDVIKTYLLTWAKNKYRFYQMLGNKLRFDKNIKYKEEDKNPMAEMVALEKDFPIYALWLESLKFSDNNKINQRDVEHSVKNVIYNLFPGCRIDNCLVTHFFKTYLNAPDELVTRIGRIWENSLIEGNYTISIHPVDMMLASENPYNWQSCYRLEANNEASHADGCLAAVLDSTSLITYIWNRKGDYNLYNNYDFKEIRYYKMRRWIAISPNQTSIHFNAIYPGKRYSDEFEKLLRVIVEDLVDKNVIWKKNNDWDNYCDRVYLYGYSEFDCDKIYKIKETPDERWYVYDVQILCPCGCGEYLPGSHWDEDDYDGYEYNGEGFIAENFYPNKDERSWCEYIDDYCDNGDDCGDCPHYNRHFAICELDEDESCSNASEAEFNGNFNPWQSNIVECGDHCKGCPLYKIHHPEENEEEN